MKVALISSIYGHGNILFHAGTSLAILMERLKDVSDLDIITHIGDGRKIKFSEKIRIIELFSYSEPLSYLKIYSYIRKNHYDLIIVNTMPTSQGSSTLSNLLFELIPLFSKIFLKRKTMVLYHNSPYLNDVSRLGYNSLFDKIRSIALKILERLIFSNCQVAMLLNSYVRNIKELFPSSKVYHLDMPFLDALPTLHLNNSLELNILSCSSNSPRILLYGSWGPQKDLETSLRALKLLREGGWRFDLTLAGGINLHNFFGSGDQYSNLVQLYGPLFSRIEGYIDELDIMPLFSSNDIIILPYRSSGGFSGVLSISMAFEMSIVAPELDEIKEQCGNYRRITFIPINFGPREIYKGLVKCISSYEPERNINMTPKFKRSIREFECFIKAWKFD